MTHDAGGDKDEPRVLGQAGGRTDYCSATLRLFGDDLDPETVTAFLGAIPTAACRKGDVTRGKVTIRVELHGKWLRSIDHRSGTDLEVVINELLDGMTDDLAVWADLGRRFEVDLFCGLMLSGWNRGLDFSPQTLKRVAERGLTLGLDIYCPEDPGRG